MSCRPPTLAHELWNLTGVKRTWRELNGLKKQKKRAARPPVFGNRTVTHGNSEAGSACARSKKGLATRPRPGACCLSGRRAAVGRSATARGTAGLPRQGSVRSRCPPFPPQGFGPGFGAAVRNRRTPLTLAVRAGGASPGLLGCPSLPRRRELHAGTTGLGQTDRNGLLRVAGAVFARAYMMHFLAHKFACLCAGRFALTPVTARAFECFFFRHKIRKLFVYTKTIVDRVRTSIGSNPPGPAARLAGQVTLTADSMGT